MIWQHVVLMLALVGGVPGGTSQSISVWDSGAQYLIDRRGLSFAQVPSERFQPANGAPALGATPARPVSLWLRFRARPEYYIATQREINDADLYSSVHGRYQHVAFGMLVPYADRAIRRFEPTAQIPPNVDAGSWVYLHVVVPTDDVAISISTSAYVAAEDAAERERLVYPLVILLSVCATLGLANLVIFAILRNTTFLLYTLTMGMAVLLGLSSRPGLGWAFVWPHASLPSFVMAQLSLLAYYACIAVFSQSFLDLRNHRPRFDRIILGALVAYVAVDVVVEWLTPLHGLWGLADVISSLSDIVYFAIVWTAGIAVWRSGRTGARFFVIAFGGILAGLIVDATGHVFIGESAILFPFVGIAWEGTLLFAALADNYSSLARERERVDAERIALVQQRAEEIEYAALHDSLTGLRNRRSIEAELSRLAGASAMAATHALAYIDLDHFKVVNDTFGHVAGDQLLVSVAERIRASVGHDDVVARIGGDEFLVLMQSVASMEVAASRAEDLREAIAFMRVMWEDQTIPLSASIGVAVARPGAADPVALMSLADAACAVAKDAGRNRVHCVADETSAARARRGMDWVGRITRAFDEGRLRLYAQTIVPLDQLRSRERFEVLIRLADVDGKIIEPSAFLPAAERFGLMPRIDGWVMEQALALCAPAARSGRLKSLAVNLSGAFLRLGNAQRMIEQSIESADFPPDLLCLEITETVVATHLGDVIGLMRSLESRGVRFALDDFGTGSSSLALLKRLRLDYVKIDGSFVRDCAKNYVDSAILESIVRLAKLLKIKTIAEYVVDATTAELLRIIGVDYGQGAAFGRAGPIEEALAPRTESENDRRIG